MSSTNLNFDSFAQDAYTYINDLAKDLGHPEEKSRVLNIWRSVMHSLRDRIFIGEAFKTHRSASYSLKRDLCRKLEIQ